MSPKQELYINARLEGASQREAYRRAYPRARQWKDAPVDVAACKLEKSPKVSLRLAELLREASRTAKWSREEAAAVHKHSLKLIDDYVAKLLDAGEDLPAHILRERRETAAELCKLFRTYDEGDGGSSGVTIVFDV